MLLRVPAALCSYSILCLEAWQPTGVNEQRMPLPSTPCCTKKTFQQTSQVPPLLAVANKPQQARLGVLDAALPSRLSARLCSRKAAQPA